MTSGCATPKRRCRVIHAHGRSMGTRPQGTLRWILRRLRRNAVRRGLPDPAFSWCFTFLRERIGDVEEHFRNLATPHCLDFIFCSVDLLTSADWDLSQTWLFDLLSAVIEEGLTDVVLGGPPCSTWSALRWLPGGPRPLRFRWTMPLGRDDLTQNEWAHCALANVLALNTLA